MPMTQKQMHAVGTEYIGVGFNTFVGGERMVVIKFTLPKMEIGGAQVSAPWYFINHVIPHGTTTSGHVYWSGWTMCGNFDGDKVKYEAAPHVEFRHRHSWRCVVLRFRLLWDLIWKATKSPQ